MKSSKSKRKNFTPTITQEHKAKLKKHFFALFILYKDFYFTLFLLFKFTFVSLQSQLLTTSKKTKK